MNWLVLALLSAAVAASINHIDKYLIEKYFKGGGIGSLVIFSSLVGLPVFLLIGFFVPEVFSINPKKMILIILNGMIYVSWLFPYLHALEKDDTSVVAPLFLLSPVLSLIFAGFILREQVTLHQFIGSLFIFLGSIGLMLKLSLKVISIKKDVYLLMLLASALVALNGVLFKYFAIQESFWVTLFWEYVGFFILGVLLLLVVRTHRQQFLEVIKLNSSSVLKLNAVNEFLAVIAKVSFNYASLLFPIALVSFVYEGFQPIFVISFGLILSIFFPHITKENIAKKHLTQKFVSIAIMIVGTYLLTK